VDAAQAFDAVFGDERRSCRRSGDYALSSRVTVMPPWRSASVTTPCGTEISADLWQRPASRPVLSAPAGRAAADVEQQSRCRPADRSAVCSRWRRAALRSAVDHLSDRPSSAATRSRNSAQFTAAAGFGGDQLRARDAAVLHLERQIERADARSPPARSSSR
jgi:hypothetical protein